MSCSIVRDINSKRMIMLTPPDKPQDLRVRRTHLLLRKAFLDLMTEKDFQSITVQDIADRAMINRATFYDHFVDKYALLEYSVRELFKETLHSKIPEEFTFSVENLHLLMLTACEYLSGLREHCLPKDQQILPLVQTQITTAITEILVTWINEAHADGVADPMLYQTTAAITSWAIYGAAFYWSQQTERKSSNEFVSQSLPLVVAGLAQVIKVQTP